MSPQHRNILLRVGSFVAAILLLYVALKGVHFDEVGAVLRQADYRWLAPLVAIVLLSFWLRAWRWKILLEALPPGGDPPGPVRLTTAFYSVSIGYMVNNAAPRVGEVARTANLSSRQGIEFSSVLGTVFVERILDVLVLLGAIVATALIFAEQFAAMADLFLAPVLAQADSLSLPAVAGSLAAVSVLAFVVYRRVAMNGERRGGRLAHRLRPVVKSFRAGVFTIVRARRRTALLVSTAGMWGCYVLMAYLPFVILGMNEPYGLTLMDSWAVMVAGAVGMAVPSPGGTGSYHYVTIQTLTHLLGIPYTSAATYAVLTHAAQVLLFTITGAVCLVIQGTPLRAMKAGIPEREKKAAELSAAS